MRAITVTEDAIVTVASDVLERRKVVVEPISATVLAALRAVAGEQRGARIGAVFSGGDACVGD